MTLVLRPALTSDYDGIVACLERNQMATWTRERWLSIWNDHPYYEDFKEIPRGFVLESDGQIVGSISSVWAKYALGDRELKAIFAGNAAVDPAHRTGSMKLFGQQLIQPGIDLYLNASAAAVTSKIMDALRVTRVPQPNNDLTLLWAARGSPVALAGLRRRNAPLAGLLAPAAGIALGIASRIALSRVKGSRYPVERARAFSEEFDRLWNTLRRDSKVLIGFRDRATLHWKYAHRIASGEVVVLTIHRDGALAAYAVLVRTPRPALGITANAIQDVQCVDDDPALVTSLLAAAWKETRIAGFELLEWAGFTGQKRAIAERSSLLRYRLDVWQAYYFARNAALKSELASPENWSFSGYDSD